MSTGDPLIWPCKPRTKAKLEILENYLGAWFHILGNAGYKHVVYLDGFCGPGKYEGGEDGSPVIAIKHANAAAQKYQGFSATIISVDEDMKCLDFLKTNPHIQEPHPNVTINIIHGKFENVVITLFEDVGISPDFPVFSFIDPFGIGESPFERIRPLMNNSSSEVFINFMCGFANRFKNHHDDQIVDQICALVGVGNLEQVRSVDDKIQEICNIYMENLLGVGRFVRQFQMRDETNVRDNAFFFCGKSPKGFEKIKEAMWKIDPVHGNQFSAYEEGNKEKHQRTLEVHSPQTWPLREMLTLEFQDNANIPMPILNRWVIKNTETFLPSHLKTELDNLLERKKITYSDPEPTGRKRRKRSWPDRIRVSFKKNGE